jgi:surface polysaccharide O-acyltransferase-like enzyme
MDLELFIFIIIMCWVIFYWIIYIIFGQVLVRKLRKNKITKNSLGLEFVSGWDILNVAFSLSYPVWMRELAKKSPLSFLEAD